MWAVFLTCRAARRHRSRTGSNWWSTCCPYNRGIDFRPFPVRSMPDLIHNLEAVKQRIAMAAHVAGRDARSIARLAVSKTFPAEDVRAAHAAGQRAFGENYVQEALTKIEVLADLRSTLEWHFI